MFAINITRLKIQAYRPRNRSSLSFFGWNWVNRQSSIKFESIESVAKNIKLSPLSRQNDCRSTCIYLPRHAAVIRRLYYYYYYPFHSLIFELSNGISWNANTLHTVRLISGGDFHLYISSISDTALAACIPVWNTLARLSPFSAQQKYLQPNMFSPRLNLRTVNRLGIRLFKQYAGALLLGDR